MQKFAKKKKYYLPALSYLNQNKFYMHGFMHVFCRHKVVITRDLQSLFTNTQLTY